MTCRGVGGAPSDITKEEQHVDRFAAELSWLRTLTSKKLFGKKIVNIVIDNRSNSEKKIGMQPGEVAGLTHVGMEPRFGDQLKDKDRRKHKEN